MKIRTDFVTNSSSSSFILSFQNDEDMEKQIREHAPIEYISRIFSDAKKNVITKEEAIEIYEDYARWEAYWTISRKKENELGSYSAYIDWEHDHPDEYEALIAKEKAKLVDKFKKKITEDSVLSIVDYDDHVTSDLEHDIMPRMPFTVIRLNNH